MQDEPLRRPDRPAVMHGDLAALGPGGRGAGIEDVLGPVLGQHPVDHEPHRAVRAVADHVDDGPGEAGVGHIRRGDQEPSLEAPGPGLRRRLRREQEPRRGQDGGAPPHSGGASSLRSPSDGAIGAPVRAASSAKSSPAAISRTTRPPGVTSITARSV